MPSDQFIWLPYLDRALVPSDLWGITWVYIGNPANWDTRSHGYQPAGVDRRMMTFPVKSSCRRPTEHVLDRGARGVKRGACRQPGHGAGAGRPPVPPVLHRHEHVVPRHVEVERGEISGGGQPTVDPFDSPNLDIPSFSLGLTPASKSLTSGFGSSQTPPPPSLGFASFQASHSTSFGFSGFRGTPPPGKADVSTQHQPISQASSSDEEERADDMDSVQHYGFGHRVGKKTTRFMPSDWP
ncbi:hypothetical protein M9H77_07337 [Catharanthus roseus]|uniref:Uncharacterized protein n=1 Tax=Catharanthus roseus TaxID=4058 RepID=A0ACC0BUL9_CATRO|nr:hypothetical protein M9H77_07337 [Catharanthus roseus]